MEQEEGTSGKGHANASLMLRVLILTYPAQLPDSRAHARKH